MKTIALGLCLLLSACATQVSVKRQPPVAPSLARAAQTEALTQSITLGWDANPAREHVTKYNLYEVTPRGGSLGPKWTKIASVPSPGVTLNNLTRGSLHVYVVTAVNNVGEGPFSIPLITKVQ